MRAVAEWPAVAERLARGLLAGASYPHLAGGIVPASRSFMPHTGKIAIRISSHPVAQALAGEIGGLLTATSANQSGQQAYRTPPEIPEELLAQVDGLLDAGSLGAGLAGPSLDHRRCQRRCPPVGSRRLYSLGEGGGSDGCWS